MKQKPIATIMRESLPQGIWLTGCSKTWQDISYTKTTKTKRWATKDFLDLTRLQTKEVNRKLTEPLYPSIKYSAYCYGKDSRIYCRTCLTVNSNSATMYLH
jgi:hypothetical protein